MNKLAHALDEDICEIYEKEEPETFIVHESESKGESILKFETLNQLATCLHVLSEDLVKYGNHIIEDVGVLKVEADLKAMMVTLREGTPDYSEEDEDENTLHIGSVVSYRMNFYTVTDIEDDGVWAEGPYGEGQWIDWEDLRAYNPDLDY